MRSARCAASRATMAAAERAGAGTERPSGGGAEPGAGGGPETGAGAGGAEPRAAHAVELRELGRAYGERIALAGVTLTLPLGRTLAVFGANGAGKTTLLRILATLLRPHAGEA